MTIEVTSVSSGPYTGTGAGDQEFPVTFQSASESEIEVTLDGVAVNPSTYTFARDADGTGTVAATLDGEVYILSAPSFEQAAAFQRQGPYFPDDLNAPLDRAMVHALWLKRQIDLLAPERLGIAERAGLFLSWDADGNPVLSSGTSGGDSALRTDLVSTIGSMLVGWLQAGVGAVLRSLSSKVRELWVSPDDFGGVGDGVTPSHAALTKAITEAATTGGVVRIPRGKSYYLEAPLTPIPGVTIEGEGRSFTDLIANRPVGKLVSAESDLFAIPEGETIAGFTLRNLSLESAAGGGHIINLDAAAVGVDDILAKLSIERCVLRQVNAGKSILRAHTEDGLFSVNLDGCECIYHGQNTVAAIDIQSKTINSFTIGGGIPTWFTAASPVNGSGTYAIHIESISSGATATCVKLENIVFEQPVGGCVRLRSVGYSKLARVQVFDMTEGGYAAHNAMFDIGKGASGPPSIAVELENVISQVGTTLKPDLLIDCSVGGQSLFLLKQCKLLYADGVAGTGGPNISIIGAPPADMANLTYLQIAGGPQADIVFGSTAWDSWTIAQGFTGWNPGFVKFLLDGDYKGAFTDDGSFQWGGTEAAPGFNVDDLGAVKAVTYSVGANQVVGAQGATVADAAAATYSAPAGGGTIDAQARTAIAQLAADNASLRSQLNALLARIRAHGLIGT